MKKIYILPLKENMVFQLDLEPKLNDHTAKLFNKE